VYEVIRARLVARPFVPFRLVLTGGLSCDVLASDLAAVQDEVVQVFARPFVPFRLVLTGGLSCDVLASDLAAVQDEVVQVFARPPGRPNGRALKAVVSLLHVVLIEDVGDGPAFVASGN